MKKPGFVAKRLECGDGVCGVAAFGWPVIVGLKDASGLRAQPKAVASPTHHRSPRRWRVCVGASNWRKRLECVWAACKGLAGAIAGVWTTEKRDRASAHSTRFARLGCVSFVFLSLLSLAPLSQAQTNRPSGTVVAWGSNDRGQRNVPPPNAGFVAVASGCEAAFGLGLKADGSIVGWGDNSVDQLNVPAPNTGFVAVSIGGGHSLGLKADGSIVAWGWNRYGQCNLPAPNTNFVAIAAGVNHSLGVKADGSVRAWGRNDFGQCNVRFPNSGFVAVAGGEYHSLGLKADGTIVPWGNNGWGQNTVPPPNSGFVGVAEGGIHSLGLRADGSIVCWGSNNEGECNVPAPNTDFVGVAAGGNHSLGLKADGSVVAWGLNRDGQTTVPVGLPPAIAIAAGFYYTVALVRDPPPSLTILRNADQTVSLSWRGAGALEQTESLTPPNWQPALSQANPQTLSTADAMKFYRVKAD